MAKESMKAREVKRAKLAKRYQHKRDEIAAKVKSGEMDHEEAWIALSKLPRNSNPIRQHAIRLDALPACVSRIRSPGLA